MPTVGIRTLKNQLSRYVRRAAAGERVLVTDRGRVVAALVPPPGDAAARQSSRYDELPAAGTLRQPLEKGDALADLPRLRPRRGTAGQLVNEDRGDADESDSSLVPVVRRLHGVAARATTNSRAHRKHLHRKYVVR